MGVGVEFGPERIRNLVIVCPKSVIPDKQKHACALSGNTEMPNISLSQCNATHLSIWSKRLLGCRSSSWLPPIDSFYVDLSSKYLVSN